MLINSRLPRRTIGAYSGQVVSDFPYSMFPNNPSFAQNANDTGAWSWMMISLKD